MDLKQRRKELGLTQIEVAKRVGVALMTYQLWEKGVGQPKPENLEKLNKVLGVK